MNLFGFESVIQPRSALSAFFHIRMANDNRRMCTVILEYSLRLSTARRHIEHTNLCAFYQWVNMNPHNFFSALSIFEGKKIFSLVYFIRYFPFFMSMSLTLSLTQLQHLVKYKWKSPKFIPA